MTLDEIMKAMYYKKETYFLDIFGKIKHNQTTLYADRNNCRSARQIERWLLLNDLLNVAQYLNGDWQPDWQKEEEAKFVLCMENKKLIVKQVTAPCHFVYFHSEEAAQETMKILGEEALHQVLEG